MKLNVLLGITDTLRIKYKNMVKDYSKFFSKVQGAFLGEKSTYTAREGMLDDPSKRKFTRIITTVDEKLSFFKMESAQFIDALFSLEKTNGSGLAKAKLVVEGNEWGEFNSLELLRLKSLLESSDLGNLGEMIESIPVRSDSEVWTKSSNEDYDGRNVYETNLIEGTSKTTEKEEYILDDPNVAKNPQATYTPQVAVRTTTVEVGDYTNQKFSGEWSHTQRAMALKKRYILYVSVIRALKECNEVEAASSELTSDRIFDYIFS